MIFFIPKWRPATLNSMIGRHHHVVGKIKKADRQIVAAYFLQSGIPKATGKRTLRVTVLMGPRMRFVDCDALWKSCLDALVACGAIVDDNPDNLELLPLEQEKAPKERHGTRWGTMIELTDVNPEPPEAE